MTISNLFTDESNADLWLLVKPRRGKIHLALDTDPEHDRNNYGTACCGAQIADPDRFHGKASEINCGHCSRYFKDTQ